MKHLPKTNNSNNTIINGNGSHVLKLDSKLYHCWHELMEKADVKCSPVWFEAEDPLFILYTRFVFTISLSSKLISKHN